MKIRILGACDSGNLGDPVICDCVAFWLRSHFPTARIEVRDVYPREPRQTCREPDMESLRTSRAKQALMRWATGLGVDLTYLYERRRTAASLAYIDRVCGEDADAVVFAGGQMFMDRYALFLDAHVSRLDRRDIPVLFNACGTGPAYSRLIAGRLKRALNAPCVRHISCRDDVALVNRRYAERTLALETFDPALDASRVYGITRDPAADTVGLGVIDNIAADHEKQLRFWQGIIRGLEKRGIKWQLFTNGDPSDMPVAREILASMPEFRGREDALIRPRDKEPEDLVRTIAGYRSIISFRLHSHIIAASLDVPSVAMVWDEKLPIFFEKIGHPERCFEPASDPELVLAALEQAEETGYDRGLLQSQAQAAETMLICALKAQTGEH